MKRRTFTFQDIAKVSSRQLTDEGFLTAKAAITRSGPLTYNWDGKLVKVNRTPETVGHKDTLASIRAAVITLDHPDDSVTAENWRELSVGNVTGDPSMDGQIVEAGIVIRDADAIVALQNGTVQLSIGYTMDVVDADDAEDFDFETVGPLVVNHVALVDRGRAGPNVRVYDKEDRRVDEETRKAIAKAVQDALGADKTLDATGVASAVAASLKPYFDRLEAVEKDQADRRSAEEQTAADAKAKEAADKLVADTIAGERKRATVYIDAMPLLTDEQRESLKESNTRDILVAAIGADKAEGKTDDFLHGMLAVLKDQKAGDPAPGGIPRTTDKMPFSVPMSGNREESKAYQAYKDSYANAHKTTGVSKEG